MPETKQPQVNVGNVFVFSNSALSPVVGTGNLQTNLEIATGAAPRSRVGTGEVLSDGPSAAVSGVEAGASRAAITTPSLVGVGSRIAPGAAIVGGVNDSINVGQHVLQANGAEVVTEALGVVGQASGAYAGGAALGKLGLAYGGPYGGVLGTLVGAGVGAYGGADGWKKIGSLLTGGDTPDKLGPPLTLPDNAALQPTITDASGNKYALVQVEGKYTWFGINDNTDLMLPSRYTEVVRGAQVAELTKNYLQASGFEQQIDTYKAQVADAQRQVVQDNFARSEIVYRNESDAVVTNIKSGQAPDGSVVGKVQRFEDGASLVWTRDPSTGNFIRVATTGSGTSATTVEQTYDAPNWCPKERNHLPARRQRRLQ